MYKIGVIGLKRPHLHEIDLMRGGVILGVVCVHLTAFFALLVAATSISRTGLDMGVMALHYTREVFMFITGLVLFYTYYYQGQFSARSFWSKRFKLIAIPYIVWNFLYTLFIASYHPHYGWTFARFMGYFGHGLLTGNLFFMYFLMVSMQFYVLFPPMLKLFRRFARYQVHMLIASFLLQLLLMGVEKYLVPHWLVMPGLPQWLHVLMQYRNTFVLTYQFWFVAGAVISVHYEAIRVWLLAHTRWVATSLLVALAALWTWYAISRWGLHESEFHLITVLQPMMVPYSFVIGIVFLTLGLAWARKRAEPKMVVWTKLIKFFGGASFGIFLIHPFALHYVELLDSMWHVRMLERIVLLPLSVIVVYGSAGVVAHYLGKVPLLGYIVGQKVPLQKYRSDRKLEKAI